MPASGNEKAVRCSLEKDLALTGSMNRRTAGPVFHTLSPSLVQTTSMFCYSR